MTINDNSAAWKIAVDKYSTGLGSEFDAQITGKRGDHESKIHRAKKRHQCIFDVKEELPEEDDSL